MSALCVQGLAVRCSGGKEIEIKHLRVGHDTSRRGFGLSAYGPEAS